jgi:gluconolactonase
MRETYTEGQKSKEARMVKNVWKTLALLWFVLSLTACSAPGTSLSVTSTPPATAAPAATSTQAAVTPTATATQAPKSPQAAAPAEGLQQIDGHYLFAEGPAVDGQGNVYFSDINAGKIYRWSADGKVSVFVEGLNGPNGLAFDAAGNLIACEGGNGRIISIDPQGNITVLADQYQGKRFNEPNDLWIDPQGGITFTDPAYNSPLVQDGEDVYYLSPDRSQVSRVIDDLVRPNGIVGTPDGKTLYVADHGAGQTFAYDIPSGGTLTNKRLFISTGSDGMDLDAAGNLYLTTPNKVQEFDSGGNHLRDISVPENPTNVAFAGTAGQTLFITARTAVYTLSLSGTSRSITTDLSGFMLTSPDIASDGLLPQEYTCDGAANTLALSWSGAPERTKSFALIMHHEASPTDIHWYWVVYNIPADVNSLPKNITGIGTLGNNSVNGRTEYTPPCSKGPGPKIYTYTVYALSAEPQLSVPASQVNRAVLLDAIRDITLSSAELNVTYSRK